MQKLQKLEDALGGHGSQETQGTKGTQGGRGHRETDILLPPPYCKLKLSIFLLKFPILNQVVQQAIRKKCCPSVQLCAASQLEN